MRLLNGLPSNTDSQTSQPQFENGSVYGEKRSTGHPLGLIGPTCPSGLGQLRPPPRGGPRLRATPVPNGPTLSGRLLWGTLLSSNPT